MAAVRRAISTAAAAGRYGLGTLGRQDALHHSMATVNRTLSSPTAAGKLGLGPQGLQARSMWTGLPKWLSEHHQKVAVDPELAFRNLGAEDKDLIVLMQLTMSDQTRRVLQSNNEGVEVVLLEFARLYDKQLDFEHGLWALVFVLGAGAGSLAYFVKDVKDQSSELLESLASNSGAIVAALVSAGKHGVGSWFLGKGEQFEFDKEWLKKKKEEKAKGKEKGEKTESEEKKVEEPKSFGSRFKSRWFTKPEEK